MEISQILIRLGAAGPFALLPIGIDFVIERAIHFVVIGGGAVSGFVVDVSR